MKKNRESKKGFTLAELLIVIAIIAILVAIMFPVFGAQLDKARAASELANVRAAYAEELANQMMGGEDLSDPVSTVSIDMEKLNAAKKYDDTVIEWTKGTNEGDKGTITVKYKSTYTGTFETDPDVTITTTPTEP